MIAHFRREGARNAQNEFNSWNTSLANEIALKQGAEPTVQVCQNAAGLEKMASTLDPRGLHEYAVAQAASATDPRQRCAR